MSLTVQATQRSVGRTLDGTLLQRAAAFVAIFLQVLVVGAFWGSWVGLSRSIDTLTPTTFVEVGHVMMVNYGPVMSVLMPVAVLATLACTVLLYRRRSAGSHLMLAGLIGMVAATAITLIVNVPIDVTMAGWTAATLPSDWTEIRDRWETFHAARTFVTVGALAATLAASLLPDRDGQR